MTDNQLKDATSPYLLQHAANPVHWRQWGPGALDEARQAGKPVLLSVGYAACHWCHVMAHESFEDPEIAAVMNEHFVNIKVDREERPDLDSIYQHALGLLGQQGGWPLTMFLTPDGDPFWGGTYFPPEPRWGRPGFAQVLERVAEIYHEETDKVDQNRRALRERLMTLSAGNAGQIQPDVPDRAAETLLKHFDPVHGGLNGAPKFPQPPALDFLWRAYLRTGREDFARAVTLTLDHVCEGGIYDHLGGGFSRYAVDETWLVPHFEKMLYDNAQIVMLLCHLWRETGRDLYRRRIEETVGWALREMVTGPGAFASSIDADSEGEEGKFYVWNKAEIEEVLGDDAETFCRAYDVSTTGNWESKVILNRLHRLGADASDDPDGAAADEAVLAPMREALLARRAERVRPGLDDKILADWNAMMITALAEASQVFGRSDWLDAAVRAYDGIRDVMASKDGRLVHSWRDGKAQDIGLLDDYAFMARAALKLYEATAEDRYVDHALAWCAIVEDQFGDPDAGGYFQTARDATDLIVRPKNGTDSAQPSANAVMVEVFARLHHLSCDDQWRLRAEETVNAFIGDAARLFYPLIGLMNGYDDLINRVEVGLVGTETKALEELRRAVWSVSLPTRSLQHAPRIDNLASSLRPESGTEADFALVCAHQTCSRPLHDAASLTTELRRRRRTTQQGG